MSRPKNEFTNVTSLYAEALGEPGKRTFRLLVSSGASSAIIWLEKEQLFQLALAVQQLLSSLGEEQAPTGGSPEDREALTHLDFEADRLALGYDSGKRLFLIDAHDEEEQEEPATIRVWAGRKQITELSEEAFRVCAAGRPLCHLCGLPIDPAGHLCPRVNGHVEFRDS